MKGALIRMIIEAIILIAIGFILIFIEIFILPSFGPIGILGIAMMIGGLILAGYREGFQTAIIYAGITFGVSLPLCAIGFWLMPKTKIGGSLILKTTEHKDEGFKSGSDDLDKLLGMKGIVITPLRPAGTVKIGNDKFDVITQGEFVAKGGEVEIIKIEGNKIIVRKT